MKKLLKAASSFILTHQPLNDARISLYNSLNLHRKGNHNDIFLFTNARGGSTLLEGIIASQRKIARVFEPLNWKRFYTERTAIEPDYRYIYSAPERREEFRKYFEKIFQNEITIHFPLAFWRDHFSFFPERYVFKLINGKELINFFESVFDIKVIYFIRHPVSTILSRINWGWHNFNKRFEYLLEDSYAGPLFPAHLAAFARKKLRSENQLEKFTAGWCVENYIPLKKLDRSKWLLISYEELLMNSRDTLTTLCDFLDIDRKGVGTMLEKLGKPSESVSAYTDYRLPGEDCGNHNFTALIRGWQERIRREDERLVFDILTRFELDCYEYGNPMPKHLRRQDV